MSKKLRKLIIQIPCYNEADYIAGTISALPRKLEGIDVVEVLVIDDGSTDQTARVAREAGADYVVSHSHNLGLARTFMTGVKRSLELGADIIVNTDADNQYCADDISVLTVPILNGKADLVVGQRPISEVVHFSASKKLLQKLGSWVVRILSRTEVVDATSGFRAMNREAALRMTVFSNYTYTLETLIQAGKNNLSVLSVPIRVNPNLRDSRLIKNIPDYIQRSVQTILRVFVIYRPFRFFSAIAILFLFSGSLIGFRFLFLYLKGEGNGHVQSLILAAILLLMGFQTLMAAFLADLISANRRLNEEIRYLLLKQSSSNG